MDVTFRPARKTDRDAVRDIFNHYAVHGFSVYRENELDGRIFDFFANGAHALLVAEDPARGVVGFGALRRFKPAPAFDATAMLTYFLLPDFTGGGLGSRLLAELEDIARRRGIDNLLAHVSSRNEESLRFHLKRDFAVVGRLKGIGVKFGKPFDVIWLQKGPAG